MEITKKDRIIELHKQGLTNEKIHEQTGYLPLYIYQVIRSHKGLYVHPRKKKKEQAQKVEKTVQTISLDKDVCKLAELKNLSYLQTHAINSIIQGKLDAASRILQGRV